MTRLVIFIITFLPTLTLAQTIPTDRQIQDSLNITAQAYLIPKSNAFATASRRFADQVADDHCGAGLGDQTIEGSFNDLIAAYVPVSIWQAGPMNMAEGVLRFQLWPDGKGFAKRAVDRAIREGNQTLLDWRNIRGQGVALINLTAMEYLVADIELIEGEYACELLIAISENYAVMAEEFADHWQDGSDYKTAFETALDGNQLYPDVQALLREALSGLRATTLHLQEKKILRPLGEQQGDARAIRGEFRRLDLSIESIAAHLLALGQLLEISGGLGELTDTSVGDSNVNILSRLAMDRSHDVLDEFTSMRLIANEDGEAAQELRELARFLNIYAGLFGTDMPEALGITAGFSSADGD